MNDSIYLTQLYFFKNKQGMSGVNKIVGSVVDVHGHRLTLNQLHTCFGFQAGNIVNGVSVRHTFSIIIWQCRLCHLLQLGYTAKGIASIAVTSDV